MMTPLPLLLVPGLMNDARVWKPQADALSADREVRIADATRHDTIRALAEDALAQAPAGRFALAGFSLGGYVAFEIVRQARERVAALALVDTGPRPDTAEATGMRRLMLSTVAEDAGRFDAVAKSFLPRALHASRVDDATLGELFVAMARAVGVDGFVRQQRAAMHRVDSRPTLATIQCPTVVVCGRDDEITPLALSEEMAASIAGARLVVVERCGHMSTLERPDEVTRALVDWLADADR